MSEESGATIKFGAGFEHSWYTPKGTVGELQQQIAEAFGLELVPGKTLAELMVEASVHAQALQRTASTLGWKPAPPQGQNGQGNRVPDPWERQTTPADVRQSIEDKVAEADGPDDPLEWEISRAGSRDELLDLRQARSDWTAEHDKLAKQRVAQLEGDQSA